MPDVNDGEGLLLGLIKTNTFPELFAQEELPAIAVYLASLRKQYGTADVDSRLLLRLPGPLRNQVIDYIGGLEQQRRDIKLTLEGHRLLKGLSEDGDS